MTTDVPAVDRPASGAHGQASTTWPMRRELALAALLLGLLGAAAFGSHVLDGGFYSDDWPNASVYRFEAAPGLPGALGYATGLRFFDYRPLSALAIAASHGGLGAHPAAHMTLALLLGVGVSLSFFWLLRELGLGRRHAGAIAALVLVFPWSDSTRLWPTAGLNNIAVCLWALGAVLALRGIACAGRRAVLVHVGAICLYVLSILTYEVAAGPVLASLLLYRTRCAWGPALQRSAVDALAVGATLAVMAANTPRTVQPVAGQLEHAERIAREAVSLLASAAVPFGRPPVPLVLTTMLLILAGGLIAWRRTPAGDAGRTTLERWLTTAVVAAVGVVAGYVLIVPADPFFSPLTPGIINRVNLFAAPALVTLVYATAAIAGTLIARATRGRRRWSLAVTGVLTLALAIGYILRLEADKRDWERSSELQRQVLATFERLDERLPAGAIVYTFGAPTYVAPGVPLFRHLDLAAAVRVERDDPTLAAYPMYPGTVFACGPTGMYPASDGYGLRDASVGPNEFRVEARAPYGTAFFLQVNDGRLERIDDRSECVVARARFHPGPSLSADLGPPD